MGTLNGKPVKTKSENKETNKEERTVSDKSVSDKPVSNRPTEGTSPKHQNVLNKQTESKSKLPQYSGVSINVKNPLSLKADGKENVKSETIETKTTGVKAFKCDNCEKGFNIKSNLLAHSKLYCEKKTIEESIPIVKDKANIISKEYATTAKEPSQHIKNNNAYNCRWCNKDFATRRNVRRHEKDSCPDKNEATTNVKDNVSKSAEKIKNLPVTKTEQERGEGSKDKEKENAQNLSIREKVTDTENLESKMVDSDANQKVQSMIYEEEEKITEEEKKKIPDQEENITVEVHEKITDKVHEKITDKVHEKITDKKEEKITDEEEQNTTDEEDKKIKDMEEKNTKDKEEEKIKDKEDEKITDDEDEKITGDEDGKITDDEDGKITDKEEDKITNRDEENITYKKGEKISNKEHE